MQRLAVDDEALISPMLALISGALAPLGGKCFWPSGNDTRR